MHLTFLGEMYNTLRDFSLNRFDKLKIIQDGKTRNGFPLGQFMIRAGLIRVKTGNSLGIVNKI